MTPRPGHRGRRLAAEIEAAGISPLKTFVLGATLAPIVTLCLLQAAGSFPRAASPVDRRAVEGPRMRNAASGDPAPRPTLGQGRLGACARPRTPFPAPGDSATRPPSTGSGPELVEGIASKSGPPVPPSRPPSAFFRAIVTAYDQSAVSCGRWAAVPIARRRTACGASLLERLTNWRPFVAGPPELPTGTLVRIPGYAGGRPVPVLDRGGAFKAARSVLRLDVFIPDAAACRCWGRREVEVEILNWPEVKAAILATEGTEK